jgi:hypothetical protein
MMRPEIVHAIFAAGYLMLAAAHVLYICYVK